MGSVGSDGVGSAEASDSVGTGTTTVADSSDVAVALSVADTLSISDAPEVAEGAVVLDASEAGVVDAADVTDSPEVADAPDSSGVEVADAPEVADALASSEVAVASPVAEDCTPDEASPSPRVAVAVSGTSDPVAIGMAGMRVVLSVVELLEATEDGLRVG